MEGNNTLVRIIRCLSFVLWCMGVAVEAGVVGGGTDPDVLEAADYGIKKMNELFYHREQHLYDIGLWLQRDNPARYVAAFNSQSPRARDLAKFGYASLQATSRLTQHYGDSRRATRHKIPNVSLLNTALHAQCPLTDKPGCTTGARYRSPDGRCNNPAHPWRGAAMLPLHRFLPSTYSDGIEQVRLNWRGEELPSARVVSSNIHEDKDKDLASITHMVMQWGQFLDHDLTSSAQSRGYNGSVPKCCSDGGRGFQPPHLMNPDCLPIRVPEDDWFYSRHYVRCLEFIRSSPTSRVGCSLGPRDQVNQVTSFLDASNVYGSSQEEADELRLFRNGLLKYSRVKYRLPLLPQAHHKADLCREQRHGNIECFLAGDKRVNEQPGLIAMHVVWMRAHNKMADELRKMNAHWDDERLYQETRRIVVAMMQHITYKEFLPIVLGPDVMTLFNLELLKRGYFEGYDINVNPTAANAFATAAFRFGHSLVQRSLIRCDRNLKNIAANVSLREEMTNPSTLYNIGSVDRLLLGLVTQHSQKRDEYITEELTNHLFQTPRFGYGMDLAAINIQRGRDHGIPPYTAWREPCGLQPITTWVELLKVVTPETQRRLKHIYTNVDDIDLFPGAMSERPVVGGLVGPTFACIIAQQFSNLRQGDRFWYENGGFESSFTHAQLQQLRRVTLARILCDNLDIINTVQPFVLLAGDNNRNIRVSCDNILNFDLKPWKTHPVGYNYPTTPPEESYEDHHKPPHVAESVYNKYPILVSASNPQYHHQTKPPDQKPYYQKPLPDYARPSGSHTHGCILSHDQFTSCQNSQHHSSNTKPYGSRPTYSKPQSIRPTYSKPHDTSYHKPQDHHTSHHKPQDHETHYHTPSYHTQQQTTPSYVISIIHEDKKPQRPGYVDQSKNPYHETYTQQLPVLLTEDRYTTKAPHPYYPPSNQHPYDYSHSQSHHKPHYPSAVHKPDREDAHHHKPNYNVEEEVVPSDLLPKPLKPTEKYPSFLETYATTPYHYKPYKPTTESSHDYELPILLNPNTYSPTGYDSHHHHHHHDHAHAHAHDHHHHHDHQTHTYKATTSSYGLKIHQSHRPGLVLLKPIATQISPSLYHKKPPTKHHTSQHGHNHRPYDSEVPTLLNPDRYTTKAPYTNQVYQKHTTKAPHVKHKHPTTSIKRPYFYHNSPVDNQDYQFIRQYHEPNYYFDSIKDGSNESDSTTEKNIPNINEAETEDDLHSVMDSFDENFELEPDVMMVTSPDDNKSDIDDDGFRTQIVTTPDTRLSEDSKDEESVTTSVIDGQESGQSEGIRHPVEDPEQEGVLTPCEEDGEPSLCAAETRTGDIDGGKVFATPSPPGTGNASAPLSSPIGSTVTSSGDDTNNISSLQHSSNISILNVKGPDSTPSTIVNESLTTTTTKSSTPDEDLSSKAPSTSVNSSLEIKTQGSNLEAGNVNISVFQESNTSDKYTFVNSSPEPSPGTTKESLSIGEDHKAFFKLEHGSSELSVNMNGASRVAGKKPSPRHDFTADLHSVFPAAHLLETYRPDQSTTSDKLKTASENVNQATSELEPASDVTKSAVGDETMIYEEWDEGWEDTEEEPPEMPNLRSDPQALKELPRPMTLNKEGDYRGL